MKTIKVTTNSSTKTIEATEVVKVLNFKKFDTLCLKTPIKLDGEVLPAGSNIDFGENATIEMDGHSVKGAANLFVNSEMASLNCQKPVEDSLAVLNASNAVGAPIDLNDISGGVGPFTYHISIHLDTTNFINSYFVVELKLSAFTLVNVHLDANHPSVTFGNTVLGVGVKGTLGVDFNGGRIYVEAELRTPFGCKKISADIPSSTTLLYSMMGGLLFLSFIIPFYLLIFPSSQPVLVFPQGSNLYWLLCLSLICTVGLYLLQIQSLKHLSAFTVNLTYNLEPCYTILIAFIFFNEARELNFSFYIGVSLIIISVMLQTWRASR